MWQDKGKDIELLWAAAWEEGRQMASTSSLVKLDNLGSFRGISSGIKADGGLKLSLVITFLLPGRGAG